MTPKFILKLREKKVVKKDEEKEILKSLLEKKVSEVAHYQNINNRLWGEMKKLPGGLDAARKISDPNRSL